MAEQVPGVLVHLATPVRMVGPAPDVRWRFSSVNQATTGNLIIEAGVRGSKVAGWDANYITSLSAVGFRNGCTSSMIDHLVWVDL